ncbi:Hypothetical protein HVR_LOCUS954 [uncultured virus]|nr:Hypothetical protein HVR_LOCUS954 [uncultured virus]
MSDDDMSYCEELVGIISKEDYDNKIPCLKRQFLEKSRCPTCRDKNIRTTDDPDGGPPSWAARILSCHYHYKRGWNLEAVRKMIGDTRKSEDINPLTKMLNIGYMPKDNDSFMKMLDIIESSCDAN